MSDEVWRREPVESPCIKVCVVHPEARLCMGCYRSIEEITGWSRMSPEARRAVMAELPSRAPLVAPARRGGRAARIARRDGPASG
ncbi:MAG TPA: DUF1289 domain-containing protein [Amaricoccus sp.]|uniref:DUF1289 domain-containing protein n=1 Tax=Amaricoccus sp. TaxID=1872485 RepID=UPI002B5252C5|nr:DUF1289 domain-containing protein [Amaricoccus sp.]HMQ94370.1 DUF1289 domain-containing protein [Amaricoccus sp.]HMR54634.1 DUF1289 domain-containing protein [Amaricoccus sp.]HMR62070.1 DUF1289 domain-containing protein [Amaricoccus sp.]HMU01677.1 DUF1289 domain-containing protein [Amaricoccus sp.]